MRNVRVFLLALLFAAGSASLAFGWGAGGVGFGAQYFDAGLSSADLGMAYITGYGYGVTWTNDRIGGFGMALLSMGNAMAGGVGGMIIGHEWRAGTLVAAITLWGGAGGAGVMNRGYMLVFGQADFELGVALLPWMQLTAYVGYQGWGNMIPGVPFSSAFLSTPVYGVRVSWGWFG